MLTFKASLLLCLVAAVSANKASSSDGQRNKKVLSLFSVVTFPNKQCTGSSSTSALEVLGTCFSSTECTSKSGKADGNCAAGFGVCCTFTASTCGSSIGNNCSYIQNPSYPTAFTTGGACEYTVSPLNSDICQLRLDFDTFDLGETTTTGVCTDSFDVTVGSSRDYQVLCGTNTGQHVYLETGRATTDQKLTFTLAASGASATWRVKVLQIACFDAWKAPSDCYQYYTGVSGSVQSFNYPTIIIDGTVYTFCVRQEMGYCGIQWTAAATTSPSPFDISTTNTVLNNEIPANNVYLTIPGSSLLNYGGNALSDEDTATATLLDTTGGAVTAKGQLFHVLVNSYAADQCASATECPGFNLVWNQLPCDSA